MQREKKNSPSFLTARKNLAFAQPYQHITLASWHKQPHPTNFLDFLRQHSFSPHTRHKTARNSTTHIPHAIPPSSNPSTTLRRIHCCNYGFWKNPRQARQSDQSARSHRYAPLSLNSSHILISAFVEIKGMLMRWFSGSRGGVTQVRVEVCCSFFFSASFHGGR